MGVGFAHAHGRRAVFSIDPGRSSWFKFDFEYAAEPALCSLIHNVRGWASNLRP